MRLFPSIIRTCRTEAILGPALHLCPPPAHADEQESPVTEKFRRFALEGVADELEDPSDDEKCQSVDPCVMEEDAGDKDGDGEKDQRNAEGVAQPVYGMLVAGRILRDPFLARAVLGGAIAQHPRG
jgi:hypothetical protein